MPLTGDTMPAVETQVGPVDDHLLDRREGVVDNERYFGVFVEYLLDGQVVRRDEAKFWDKVNPFANSPAGGLVTADLGDGRGIVDIAARDLDRKTGVIDTENEYTCWVEYRMPGTDTIVHRSCDVKLKKSTVVGAAVAAHI